MIKKHQKRYIYICKLPKNVFEAATKETFETTKKNPNMVENLCQLSY